MSRLQLAGAVALLLVSSGWFAVRCAHDPALPYLPRDPAAPWIGFPTPPDGLMGVAERDALPRTGFRRRFDVPDAGAPGAWLRIRALRSFRVHLNGQLVPIEPPAHWRRFRGVALGERLRRGRNQLLVEVVNATGPALLSLRLDGLPEPLESDEGWRVSRDGGPWRLAARISTEQVNPSTYALPTPLEGLGARAQTVALVFAATLAGALALRRPALGAWRARLERALPLLVVLAWTALLLGSFVRIPLRVGFDAHHHLAYVDFLREHGALPRATDGWMMFHPPLYYALTAALVELQERLAPGRGGLLAWRLVGFGAGLASALLCGALARRLFAPGSREVVFATLFGACLPMNVYVSGYLTNESLAAALSGGVVVAAAGGLRRGSPSRRDLLVFAGLVSLAVLTKYTAWIVACVTAFFLVVRWRLVERAPAAAVAGRLALVAGAVAVLAGWLYARNLALYGDLFPLNVDLPGQTRIWWSPPGFATSEFFWRFGSVLTHPFLAGAHTAWDSFYATLWGDGQLAGQVFAAARHPYWDWELMAFDYWLAVPATLLLAAGAVRSLGLAFRAGDPGLRALHSMLLTLAYALFFSVLYMTLRQPDYGQAKAFYALAATPALAVFFAQGAAALDRCLDSHAPRLRPVLHATLATTAILTWLTYSTLGTSTLGT